MVSFSLKSFMLNRKVYGGCLIWPTLYIYRDGQSVGRELESLCLSVRQLVCQSVRIELEIVSELFDVSLSTSKEFSSYCIASTHSSNVPGIITTVGR